MSKAARCASAWLLILAPALAALAGEAALAPCGWRGDGTGLYPKAAPPTEWDIDTGKNILWRAEVGRGQSTPVVVGGRIFITAEQDLLLCLDRATGKVLWRKDNGYEAAGVKAPEKRPPAAPGCGYSTPTPVSDGKAVFASYGTGIVACYEPDGARRWIRLVEMEQTTEYGRSASPVLAGGKLLVSLGGVVALDPQTGKTLWEANDAKCSYGTPAVARIGDADVAVTPQGDCVRASDGKLLATRLPRTKYTSPLIRDGVVFFADSPAVAFKLPGKPDEPFEPRKLWENEDLEGEFIASPVCHEGLLYCVSNQGTLYVLDAKTGKMVYQKELPIPSAGGAIAAQPANLYPSLGLVGKHLIITNDAGNALVLAPGREYKEVARNSLDKGSGASPVAEGKHLFLRAGKRLYCIGAK